MANKKNQETAPEALGDSTPFTILEVVMVVVEGPLMTKVEKSSLEIEKKNDKKPSSFILGFHENEMIN